MENVRGAQGRATVRQLHQWLKFKWDFKRSCWKSIVFFAECPTELDSWSESTKSSTSLCRPRALRGIVPVVVRRSLRGS
jgi:hypothetical protein